MTRGLLSTLTSDLSQSFTHANAFKISSPGCGDDDLGVSMSLSMQSPPSLEERVGGGGEMEGHIASDHSITGELEVCQSCSKVILDKYLLHVNGKAWHATCLRCTACLSQLSNQLTCFVGKDNQLYCKNDYIRYFGIRCAKCDRVVSSTDWVRRAKQLVYHLACFACNVCHRQLSTGEEFALHDHHVLCRQHYLELMDIPHPHSSSSGIHLSGGSSSSTAAAGSLCSIVGNEVNDFKCTDSSSNNGECTHDDCGNGGSSGGIGDMEGGSPCMGLHGNKSKRSRTTFSEDQLKVLQANFNMDSNPDGQDLERIAAQTGLSKRVIQVWFQNARSRQKKHLSVGTPSNLNASNSTSVTSSAANTPQNIFGTQAVAKLHHHTLAFAPNFEDMSPSGIGVGLM